MNIESKNSIRTMIWDTLEEKKISKPPKPVYGRIPNFKGSNVATKMLTTT